MPARNSLKQYVEDGFYHVYNRGVDRRRIFLDDNDYNVFLYLLKYYLSEFKFELRHPLTDLTGFEPRRVRPIQTVFGQAHLHAYCLMPNHFHLLIRQKSQKGMENLLRRLLTTYVLYFNRRYDREGHLFQGTYKACLVDKDEYLLHLSRYIHQNPSLTKGYLSQYPYSSYSYYIGEKKSDWLKTDFILGFFRADKGKDFGLNGFSNYREFTEGFDQEPQEIIGHLAID